MIPLRLDSPLPQSLAELRPGELVSLFTISDGMCNTIAVRGRFASVVLREYYQNGPVHPVVTIIPERRRRPIAWRMRESSLLVRGLSPIKTDSEATEGLRGHVFSGAATLQLSATADEVRALLAGNLNPLFEGPAGVCLVRPIVVDGWVKELVSEPLQLDAASA